MRKNDTHGTARLEDDEDGDKRLVITTETTKQTAKGPKIKTKKQTYKVEDLRPDDRVAKPAFRLTKEDGEAYDVAVNEFGATCSCPDGQFRRENDRIKCKHVKAMRAVGLLPPEPTYGREQPPEEEPLPW